MILAAKRRSGKSYMIKEILKIITKKYDYYSIIIFSNTARFEKNKSYGFIDNDMIFTSE